jgi:hypothetical protein
MNDVSMSSGSSQQGLRSTRYRSFENRSKQVLVKTRDFGTIGVVFVRYCIPARGKGFDGGVELTKFFSGRNEQIVL